MASWYGDRPQLAAPAMQKKLENLCRWGSRICTMMRQQIQSDDGDDEGIRICVLLHRNVEVVFDLLRTRGNYSVPTVSTWKEMKKNVPCLAKKSIWDGNYLCLALADSQRNVPRSSRQPWNENFLLTDDTFALLVTARWPLSNTY